MKRPRLGAPRAIGVSLLVAFACFSSADAAASAPALSAATFLPAIIPPLTVDLTATEPEPPAPQRPTREVIMAMVQATWPQDQGMALRILECESHAGDDPDTFDVEAENGGPMQINRATWGWFFAANYGWTWEQVVTDLGVHLQAARIIYDRYGDWSPWRCR